MHTPFGDAGPLRISFFCDCCLSVIERLGLLMMYRLSQVDVDNPEVAFAGEWCDRCGDQADWAFTVEDEPTALEAVSDLP